MRISFQIWTGKFTEIKSVRKTIFPRSKVTSLFDFLLTDITTAFPYELIRDEELLLVLVVGLAVLVLDVEEALWLSLS